MQNKFNSQYQVVTEDVYADVDTSISRNTFASDSQEFSLDAISQKLGATINQNTVEGATVSTPDIEPTSQTINMSFERNYAPVNATATKMSNKTKAIVISYVAVVLMLVLAVTLCGVSVSGAFTSAVAIDAQYSEVSSKLDELTQVAAQEDYTELVNRAESLGYVDASSSNTLTYTEVETRPAQNINVQTNWFDSLCDWLCGVFGA